MSGLEPETTLPQLDVPTIELPIPPVTPYCKIILYSMYSVWTPMCVCVSVCEVHVSYRKGFTLRSHISERGEIITGAMQLDKRLFFSYP